MSRGGETSVEEAFTRCRAAQAGDAVHAADFSFELVVVRQLLVWTPVSMIPLNGPMGNNLLMAMSRSA